MINTLMTESEEEQKNPLSVTAEIEKACLKLSCFHFFPIYLPWSDGTGCMIFISWMLSSKSTQKVTAPQN